MDDLVKRLRASGRPSWDDGAGGNGLMMEAADRIEVLEAQVAAAAAYIKDLEEHEGAEGFSVSTEVLAAAYRKTQEGAL